MKSQIFAGALTSCIFVGFTQCDASKQSTFFPRNHEISFRIRLEVPGSFIEISLYHFLILFLGITFAGSEYEVSGFLKFLQIDISDGSGSFLSSMWASYQDEVGSIIWDVNGLEIHFSLHIFPRWAL